MLVVPAYSDVSVAVEACAESVFHIVRNESSARPHKRAVCVFSAVFLVPESDIGESENLVVKKIDSSDVRSDVEKKHKRTLNTEIRQDCWKRRACERSSYTAYIQLFWAALKCAEIYFSVVNDFIRRGRRVASIHFIYYTKQNVKIQ